MTYSNILASGSEVRNPHYRSCGGVSASASGQGYLRLLPPILLSLLSRTHNTPPHYIRQTTSQLALREGTGVAAHLGAYIVRPRTSHHRQHPLAALSVRPRIQMQARQRRCRLRIQPPSSPDILRLPSARARGVARRHHRLQHSHRQYSRHQCCA